MNVAIIGAGLMGRWHLFVARKLGAAVTAIVDPDAAAASRLAARVSGARVFGSVEELLEKAPPSAAHVCTPRGGHFPIAKALLEGGVHALVEKPLCESVEDTRELVQLARERGLALCPVHQYAFQRGVERALSWKGGLGAIRRIAFEIRSAGADAFPSRKQSVVAEILPHPLSMVQRLAPEASVETAQWSVAANANGEFAAMASTSGPIISISISMNARPTCFLTRLEADGGVVEIDGFHGFATLERGARASRSAKALAPFARSINTLTAATANLAERAARNEPAYPGLSELVRRFYLATGDETLEAPVSSSQIVAAAEAWRRLSEAP